MRKTKRKNMLIPSLGLMLALLVSCIPAGPTATAGVPLTSDSKTAEQASPTLTQTETGTRLPLPTNSPTLTRTFTLETSLTPIFIPGVSVQPTRTRRPPQQKTTTPSPTKTFTPTPPSQTPTATRCPTATHEPFYVDPVTSPTDQLSQVVTVYLGYGEQVTIITESGTFIDTTSPFGVNVTLLPNTVHHLEVRAKVKEVWTDGCRYGGYTLSTTRDGYGAPLTIVQGISYP